MTAPTPDGDDRHALRTPAVALVATAAVWATALGAAAAAAPEAARTVLVWAGAAAGVALCAAVAVTVRARDTARRARHRLDAALADVARLERERTSATEETRREQQRLIDELSAQRQEFSTERVRLEKDGARELEELRHEVHRLSADLERARRERAAAVSATSNAAGRMQALATATLADLRAMEERHGDEEVLADLLHLDHRTAQAGRLADSVAVLTGARSGRRWARPIAMESILRGAMGRIGGYQRVRVHSVSDSAVAGHAAEGVMHALAELLDNATNFSPPTAEVHVYVEGVPAGVIISVEDSGLVMGDVQLRRAEKAVTGDVSGLGGLTGTRLGLAVVGRLAHKYGLKVSFRPSARGGTGVLMLVPQEILTGPEPAPRVAPAPAPKPAAAPVRKPPAPAAPAADEADGLPRRRRGRTLAEAERSRSASRGGTRGSAADPAEAKLRAARFSSFRQAVRPGEKAGDEVPRTRPAQPPKAGPAGDPAETPPPTQPHTHLEGDPTP
ncbi:ATP-binding protein [Streptomyces sp. NPDC046860]|uniref:ATP-binding protein n=1 Tax=Streptomyces sp. NPDC046860 TaxID=3154495 RepID=UPI0033F70F7E